MTPYRTGGSGASRCQACGAERSPDARACSACGAEFPAVRCAACMTLNPIGESACRQCGVELGLEPEPSPTRLLCPRGCGGLVATFDVSECEMCGGIFIAHDALAELVTRHRSKDGERRASIVPPTPAPDAVVYLPCPACRARMNRTVFGKSSGVIVDVCGVHGTWFDARELTASLAFVERGGLELVERRERERRAEAARRAAVERRVREIEGQSRPGGGAGMFDDDGAFAATSISGLLDILLSL
jgi:Zn-finger nucleic acid-binding protein